MPRRKQDCPKRMKWELENIAALAALRAREKLGGGEISSSNLVPSGASLQNSKNNDSSDCSSDEGHKSSGSEEGSPISHSPSRSPSHSPSQFRYKSSSPVGGSSTKLNGSILDLGPLDLSVSHKPNDFNPPPKKIAKWSNSSPNGSHSSNSELMSSKSLLEKMSELSRVGNTESKSHSGKSGSGSSWQAQWLAQSSCGTKDVLRCVSCRAHFPTLSALSAHMKEENHGPPLITPPSYSPSPKNNNQIAQQSPLPSPQNNSSGGKSALTSPPSSLLKETVHLPRKLVRGQDVWLGKGAEQTRQILKCMWCGQSFRSLAEMTTHMEETQHYTNIISQEQLISWRSSEDKTASPNSHVSAVLTCKVCDQAFSSLKELSNHMVKNSHYKEHIMRSITESGSRRRQSREKRKKSLPVRKLLELERANTEFKKEVRISCEKCGERIPAPVFVEHLRTCEKITQSSTPDKNKEKNFKNNSGRREGGEKIGERIGDKLSEKNNEKPGGGVKNRDKEPSSVLNAIEKMIEKSFDMRGRSGGAAPNSVSPPVGTSILKRLGIDESVDYTKPLLDSSLMHKFPRPHSASSAKSEKSEDEFSRTPTPKKSDKNHPSESETEHELESDLSEKTPKNYAKNEKNDVDEKGAKNYSMNHHSNSATEEEEDEKNYKLRKKYEKYEKGDKSGSLAALSSMFEGRFESPIERKSPYEGSPMSLNSNSGNNNAKSSSHPLAALQQLCDKTETTPHNVNNSTSSRPTSTSSSNPQSSPGCESGLLGHNWGESGGENTNIFKCTLCDTPFLSKGAYRHHLAKVHFVTDKSPPTPQIKEELPPDSPASKFIKYTELAKQLSSK